jgi:hypothetical protein
MIKNTSSDNLRTEKRYLKFSAFCALITVFTTIAIHRIHVPSGNFEENVLLYKNSLFLLLNWIIMFHCLMVLFSMLGAALVIEKHSRALAILGFLFIALFVFSEWQRTLNTLWHINGLRRKYTLTADESTLQFIRFEIQNRLSQSNVLFLLFILGFSLGNGCYGLAMIKNKGLDRYIGAGLLIWFCCTACAFIYDFVPAQWLGTIVDICNKYYQPVIRLALAYWLLQKAIQVRIIKRDIK